MLILTRKPGESLYIGDNVKVTIVEMKGNQIRVGIDAPSDLRIYREEIYLQILDENKKAAEGMMIESSLEEITAGWKLGAAGGQADGDKSNRKAGAGLQPRSPSVLVRKRSEGTDKVRVSADSPDRGEGEK
jgi:carbon storage regulator